MGDPPDEFLENKRRHTKEEQRGGRGLPGSEGDSWTLLGEEGEGACVPTQRFAACRRLRQEGMRGCRGQ